MASPVESPVFWLGFLVVEVALPLLIPDKRWAALVMLALGALLLASGFGWLHLLAFPIPRRVLLYLLLAAIPFSVTLGFLQQVVDELRVKRAAFALGTELQEFAGYCRGRLVPSLGHAQKLPEQNQQRREFLDRYSARIGQVSRALVARGASWPGLDTMLLGGTPGSTLDTADQAWLAGSTLTKLGRFGVGFVSNRWLTGRVVRATVRSSAVYFFCDAGPVASGVLVVAEMRNDKAWRKRTDLTAILTGTAVNTSGGSSCDLVGSTRIAAQLDPEEWRETVAAYHRGAAEAIIRFRPSGRS